MMRRARNALIAATVAGALSFAAGAAAQPAPLLQGTFHMSGTVTVAHNVLGEHVGDVIERTWTFTPQCTSTPCATVQLVRQRAVGADTLTLRETGPGRYAGAGKFFAPLRCSGHVYSPGQVVPFKITVRVTATGPSGAATAISATYVNRKRLNLTPCIGVLGHDAARYSGQLAAG